MSPLQGLMFFFFLNPYRKNVMNKLRIIKIVKLVTAAVVGYGTEIIVKAFIDKNVEPENFRGRVSVNATSWVVSAMAVEATKKYTDAKIDDADPKV
jgi:hypothetical protein